MCVYLRVSDTSDALTVVSFHSGLPDELAWGQRKRLYYNADYSEYKKSKYGRTLQDSLRHTSVILLSGYMGRIRVLSYPGRCNSRHLAGMAQTPLLSPLRTPQRLSDVQHYALSG